jgi:hypothetical protein
MDSQIILDKPSTLLYSVLTLNQEEEMKTTKRTVNFDGRVYSVKSSKTEIPNLAAMDRFSALKWLISNTYARGYSRNTNPLAGIGNAIKVS